MDKIKLILPSPFHNRGSNSFRHEIICCRGSRFYVKFNFLTLDLFNLEFSTEKMYCVFQDQPLSFWYLKHVPRDLQSSVKYLKWIYNGCKWSAFIRQITYILRFSCTYWITSNNYNSSLMPFKSLLNNEMIGFYCLYCFLKFASNIIFDLFSRKDRRVNRYMGWFFIFHLVHPGNEVKVIKYKKIRM